MNTNYIPMLKKNSFSQIEPDNITKILRLFAIICVICAHVSSENSMLKMLYAQLGTYGVSIFLFLSGQYFRVEKYKTFTGLLKTKFIRIIFPSMIAGTLVYIYTILIGKIRISLINLALYLVGYKTYLYYSTVLVTCMLIVYYFHSKKWLLLFIASTIISVILTASGKLGTVINIFHITNYLNLFNWIGFFALGFLIKTYYYNEFLNIISNFRIVIIICFNIIFFLLLLLKVNYGYFSNLGLLMEIFGIVYFYSISSLKMFRSKILEKISRYTFQIYLYHMPTIGVVYTLIGKHSVILVFLVTLILFLFGFYFAKLVGLSKIFSLLTGLNTVEKNS